MDRRSFLRALPVVGVAPLAFASVGASDEGVPQFVDCRMDGSHSGLPVVIYRRGVELPHVIAYSIPGQWVRVLKEGPDGKALFDQSGALDHHLYGGIVVKWDRKRFT